MLKDSSSRHPQPPINISAVVCSSVCTCVPSCLYCILLLHLLAASLLLPLLLLLPFSGDFMRDFSKKLVPLLEDKIRVMIYAGVLVQAQALHRARGPVCGVCAHALRGRQLRQMMIHTAGASSNRQGHQAPN